MGAGVTKKDNNVKTSIYKGTKFTDIKEINGALYSSSVSRKDFKLNNEVMGVFSKFNNFSCDLEEGTKKTKLVTMVK
jgi:hypothetical protein